MEANTNKTPDTPQMIWRKEGAIGWMIFNRPERHNAVSFEMWEAIPRILDEFEADNEVRVIVLRGAGGKAFISGADISQFEEKRSSEEATAIYNEAVDVANNRLHTCPKPTIAMIEGYCIGGGAGLAVCCDFRVASPDSTFAIPAAKLGLGYGFPGVKRLVDLIGPSYAKEIFYTARKFSAQEAAHIGLINRMVERDGIEAYIQDFAGTIAANAPMTIHAVKVSVAETLKDGAERDLGLVERLVDECFASEDYQERRRAFMEKSKPVFKNR